MTTDARLVCDLTVIEAAYRPGLRIVADITRLGRGNMVGPLPLGNNTVMATFAGPLYFRMVNGGCRLPLRCTMAGRAIIGRSNMIIGLAGRNLIVVAANARTNDLAMIHANGGQPVVIGMTGLTAIRAGDMIRRFTGLDSPVMAFDTRLPANRLMIKG